MSVNIEYRVVDPVNGHVYHTAVSEADAEKWIRDIMDWHIKVIEGADKLSKVAYCIRKVFTAKE